MLRHSPLPAHSTHTIDSATFPIFFKMFFVTIIFGLLHGVVLLPILLSLVGPAGAGGEGDDTPGSPSIRERHTATSGEDEEDERLLSCGLG